jgi:hypothetical protein
MTCFSRRFFQLCKQVLSAPTNKHSYFLAIYEHRHGTDYCLFRSPESAERWRQRIALEYWQDEMRCPLPNAPPHEIADAYFESMSCRGLCNTEFFSTEELEILP